MFSKFKSLFIKTNNEEGQSSDSIFKSKLINLEKEAKELLTQRKVLVEKHSENHTLVYGLKEKASVLELAKVLNVAITRESYEKHITASLLLDHMLTQYANDLIKNRNFDLESVDIFSEIQDFFNNNGSNYNIKEKTQGLSEKRKNDLFNLLTFNSILISAQVNLEPRTFGQVTSSEIKEAREASQARHSKMNTAKHYHKLACYLLEGNKLFTINNIESQFLNALAKRRSHSSNPKKSIELLQKYKTTNELSEIMTSITHTLRHLYQGDEVSKTIQRLDNLLSSRTLNSILTSTHFSTLMQANVIENDFEAVYPLLKHASTAGASKPSKKWLSTASDLVSDLEKDKLVKSMNYWLNGAISTIPKEIVFHDDETSEFIRGLIWITRYLDLKTVGNSLVDLAIFAFKKQQHFGQRSPKVGNAILNTLSSYDISGVEYLSKIKMKVKYPSSRKMIDKILSVTAEKNNISKHALVEISADNFGLNSNRNFEQTFDDFTAVIELKKNGTVTFNWKKSTGKIQKTIPKHVKDNYKDELKNLKLNVKSLGESLSAHSKRLENLYLHERTWSYEQWHKAYIEHPVMSNIGQRLIWQFIEEDKAPVNLIYSNKKFINALNDEVDFKLEKCSIKLWHPIFSKLDEIQNWRDRLFEQEIFQPFKQAFREIYLLTPAEEQTQSYSNRFASHILKQHQLVALCRERGWEFSLIGQWDSYNYPTLNLPQFQMRAEYWVSDHVNEFEANQMGIYNYVPTDRLHFCQGQNFIDLKDISPIVLTEVMRDVDLFVGVCSIGNDPNWQDGGNMEHREYWGSYSFGELQESAKTRKEVLKRLIPKLKIREQLSIDNKFLIVKGHHRTYKIHLGSSNILMEPGDQYLCIVADHRKSKKETIFIPFEEDKRLSLILSKAALLANDKEINDSTILAQIRKL